MSDRLTEEREARRQRDTALERHVQTALVFVITGLLAWMTVTTHSNRVQLAIVSTKLSDIRDNDEELEDVEQRLAAVETEIALLRQLLTEERQRDGA